MNKMNKFLSVVIVYLFLLGCSTSGEGYMQQNELLEKIGGEQSPIIIDVRSLYEYKAGHIPGAIHIPFWTALTTDKLEGLFKTEALVVYCEHGPRAVVAKLALSLSGFENISYLAGNMTAWKKSGLPVEVKKAKE